MVSGIKNVLAVSAVAIFLGSRNKVFLEARMYKLKGRKFWRF